MSLYPFSLIVGLILLFVLCWNDFKDKVVRPKSSLRFYSAYILFMAVNVFLYFSILAILGSRHQSLYSSSIHAASFEPVLIGLMYFGAGAARFKIAGKEFAPYQKLIDVFKVLFRMSPADMVSLWERIKTANVEYAKYEEAFQAIELLARESKSKELMNAWRDVNNDRVLINDQINELADIQKRISELISSDNIVNIVNDIEVRKKQLREKMKEKLHKFIIECLVKDIKSEIERERIVRILIAYAPTQLVKKIAMRATMTTFLFGLTFGPIFSQFSHKDPLTYSWIGACSFAVFGLVFALLGRKIEKNKQYLQVFAGGVAGAVAYIFWKCSELRLDLFAQFGEVIKKSVIGLEFGAVIGLLLHLLGPLVAKAVSGRWVRFAGIGMAGGIAFFLLAWTISSEPFSPAHLGMLPLGIVVMIAMTEAFDIFEPEGS